MEKAHLYNRRGDLIAVVTVADPPPDGLTHRGRHFDRSGSQARVSDDAIEWVGWDYLEAEGLAERYWWIDGPHFKSEDKYLSKDGNNPEAPQHPMPGYGWPLGTECWFFTLSTGPDPRTAGRKVATGLTVESAWRRAVEKFTDPTL